MSGSSSAPAFARATSSPTDSTRAISRSRRSTICSRIIPTSRLDDVDYIIVGLDDVRTTSYPSLSAMLQAHYGLPKTVGALDISDRVRRVCLRHQPRVRRSSRSGQCERVLVVAADALTRSVDYTDRSTAVLFGDGGGAALVEYSETAADLRHGCRQPTGTAESSSTAPACAARSTASRTTRGCLRQDGRDVYRWVLENIPPMVARILERAGMTLEDIDWFVPHSANLRMIEALDKRLGFSDRANAAQRRRVRQYVGGQHPARPRPGGARRPREARRQRILRDGLWRRIGDRRKRRRLGVGVGRVGRACRLSRFCASGSKRVIEPSRRRSWQRNWTPD